MGSLGHDTAAIKHDNPVCFFHGRQPMRDDQRRAAHGQRFDRRLHRTFRFRVQRAGRLIQQKHGRIPQNGPRNRNSLLLPA